MATVGGTFSIGEWQWGPQWGNLQIKYKSAAANDQVKADGKDDARQTYKGRKVAEIDITIVWKVDKGVNGDPGPIEIYVDRFLTAISPRGVNAGKSWAWAERRARIHAVNNVTVDDITTTDTPGTGSASATLKLSSWVKPAVKPAVTATPAKPEPWSPGPQTATFVKRTLPGFGNTPVKVKP